MATNLWLPFTCQLDAGGNGTAGVGAPAMGYNWQAFVTFGTAPSGQSFTVSVLGQVVASGGRQSGPFAAGSGNTVTVTVSGGPASTTVNGVVQGAINQGVAAQAPLPSSGSLIEIAAGTIDATITGPVSLAPGTAVDANITNSSLPISGSVSISSGTIDATLTGPVDINSGQTIITEVGSVTDIAIANGWAVAGNTFGPGSTWYTLLPANASRRGLILYANWTGSGVVGIGLGTTAANFWIFAGQYWEMPAPFTP